MFIVVYDDPTSVFPYLQGEETHTTDSLRVCLYMYLNRYSTHKNYFTEDNHMVRKRGASRRVRCWGRMDSEETIKHTVAPMTERRE
jgi:hypothetical protein